MEGVELHSRGIPVAAHTCASCVNPAADSGSAAVGLDNAPHVGEGDVHALKLMLGVQSLEYSEPYKGKRLAVNKAREPRHGYPTKGQPPERLTRDDVLDNITLYWLTNTGVSAARSYWDNKPPYFGPKNLSIPAAFTVFPGEIYQPSRRWAERGYSNLSYFHEADKGGHFAAWEEPLLFASEMRAAFKSLR